MKKLTSILILFIVYSDFAMLTNAQITSEGPSAQFLFSDFTDCKILMKNGQTQSLKLNFNISIADNSVKLLTNLTYLNLEGDRVITYNSLKELPNLTSLNLSGNDIIMDNDIKQLTNLTSLVLESNEIITDNGIKGLTNLTFLNLDNNGSITNDGIKGLINLTTIILYFNEIITNDILDYLCVYHLKEIKRHDWNIIT